MNGLVNVGRVRNEVEDDVVGDVVVNASQIRRVPAAEALQPGDHERQRS